ncbi:uncharacterized protein YALI1_F21322g [Yarrowia lipolytica]|nr:hypothetical protein YALI1_F21322g [Yarrowia lipolytica]
MQHSTVTNNSQPSSVIIATTHVHSNMADSAQKAFDEKRYVDSVKLFNVFMKDHPKRTTPDHFLLRSTALLRLGKKEAALRDADRATRLAYAQKSNEALGKAQMRRAVTYVSLGDNAAAKKCVDFAETANPEERTIPVWKAKIGMSSGSNEASDVPQIPDIDISYVWKGPTDVPVKHEVKPEVKKTEATATTNDTNNETQTPKPSVKPAATQETPFKVPTSEFKFEPKPDVKSDPMPAPMDDSKSTASSRSDEANTSSISFNGPKEDLRTDFFQSNEKITVSIYRKNTPKDAKCDIQPTSISIICSMYSWSTQLYAPIVPSESSVQIYGTKVDFTLMKKTPAKWPTVSGNASLNDDSETPIKSPSSTTKSGPSQITNIDFFQTPTHINAYLYMPNLVEYEPAVIGTPSSFTVTFTNNNDPKNSFVKTVFLHGLIEPELLQFKVYPTKLEVQMRKKTSGNWPSLEKGVSNTSSSAIAPPTTKDWSKIQIEDDSDDDLNSENPDDFFKALYADADDDTRRAMMKSFVESGGTSLSTDWDKVEKGEHS